MKIRKIFSNSGPSVLTLLPRRVRKILRLACPYVCLTAHVSQKNHMFKFHEIFYRPVHVNVSCSGWGSISSDDNAARQRWNWVTFCDQVTRESSGPETQLTRSPCSIMNSKCRLMCEEVFSGQRIFNDHR